MRTHLVKKPGLQASSIVASDAAMAVISREAALRRHYSRSFLLGVGIIILAAQFSIEVKAEPLMLSGANAISLGMLTHELITNAVKHAYSDDISSPIKVF